MPISPEEFRLAIERLAADLKRIEDQAGAAREEAIRASGLDPGMAESVIASWGKSSELTSRPGYATVAPMPSTETVTEKHPGPIAEGPVAKLSAELGFASLAAFAEALEEPYDTVRSWNREGRGLPSRVRAAVDKLRDERKAALAKSKRKG